MADNASNPQVPAQSQPDFPPPRVTWILPRTGITDLPLLGGVFIGSMGLLIGAALGAVIGDWHWARVAGMSGGYAGVLACWWHFAYMRRTSFWRAIGKPVKRRHIVPLCLACIPITGVRLGWLSALATWDMLPKAGEAAPGTAQAYLFYGVVTVLDPIVEEILFRGFLFWQLARWMKPISAAVVSSVLFGVLHMDPVGVTCTGLILVALYARTQTLWVPIVAHGVLNGLALLPGSDRVWAFVLAHRELVWSLQLLFVPWFVWLCIQGAIDLRGFSVVANSLPKSGGWGERGRD